MMVHRNVFIIATFCLVGSLQIAGCATTKMIADDIMGKGGPLKKKISLLPTMNGSNYGGKTFQKETVVRLKTFLRSGCRHLCIMDSRKIREDLKAISRLPSGQIDNLALANLGRIYGLSAVLEHGIAEIQCFTDKRGIWGFRHTHMLVSLSFRVRAYDVETTAVLLDETVESEVELSEEAWQEVKRNTKHNQEISRRLLGNILPEVADKICTALNKVPWKGYITGSSEGNLNLSAGEEVGLAVGDVLEVFGIGDPVEGQGGHVYLVSGPKIGEIKITRVQRHQAEAIAISGSDLHKSSCVKPKP